MSLFNRAVQKNCKGSAENGCESIDFYQATSDWAYEIYQSQSIWLRCALLGLVVLAFLLGLSIITNLCLIPLKEKVPYLYAFDHATGEITKIGTLEPTVLSANWALSRFLLIHYVINNESFDIDNMDHSYQLVWAQSDLNIQKQYEERVSSNADSNAKRNSWLISGQMK